MTCLHLLKTQYVQLMVKLKPVKFCIRFLCQFLTNQWKSGKCVVSYYTRGVFLGVT